MVGILVVTHGRLAEELVNAATTIVGDISDIDGVSIGWNDDVERAREAMRSAIKQLDTGSGVLILTDMFGGTPTNISLTFLEQNRIEIVTGVNLPMVVKFGSSRENGMGLTEMAKAIQERGARSIRVASEILADSSGDS